MYAYPYNFPIRPCKILKEYIEAPTNILTFIDVLLSLVAKMKRKPEKISNQHLNRKTRKHFNMLTIGTSIECLLLIQRHCKRVQDTVPRAIQRTYVSHLSLYERFKDQTYQRMAVVSDSGAGANRRRAMVSGAEHEKQIICRLCDCLVEEHHWEHSHSLNPDPRPFNPCQDLGPGNFFVSDLGGLYTNSVAVLGRMLLSATKFTCIPCWKRGEIHAAGTGFNNHLLQHLPAVVVPPRKKLTSENLEVYLDMQLGKQQNLKLPGFKKQKSNMLKKHIQHIRLAFEAVNAEGYENTELAKLAAMPNKNLLSRLREMANAEEDSLMKKCRMVLFKRALNTETIETNMEPILLSDEQYRPVFGMGTNTQIVVIGFTSLFPLENDIVATYKVSGPILHIPIDGGKTGLYKNEIKVEPSSYEARAAMKFRSAHYIFEISPYEDDRFEMSPEFMARQVATASSVHSTTLQNTPPLFVLSPPTAKMLHNFSVYDVLKRTRIAENQLLLITYLMDELCISLMGRYLPEFNEANYETRLIENDDGAVVGENAYNITFDGAWRLKHQLWKASTKVRKITTRWDCL